MITVHEFAEVDQSAWDSYVARQAHASIYHLAGWRKIIEDCFCHKTRYLYATGDGGEVCGVMPLVHHDSLLFGSVLYSLPYFTYGGIVADTVEAEERLLTEAIRVARDVGAKHLEIRQEAPCHADLPAKTNKVSMRLALTKNAAELWERLPSKLRSQIRKPSKEGMTVAFGGDVQLDGFYDVFCRNMRNLGTPVYDKGFFRAIIQGFPSQAQICTVYSQHNRPVASGFLLGFKDRLEIPWASSLRAFSRSSPNMLLYWSVLEYACRNGYAEFDFGRSSKGEGTYRFKEQWGAQPSQLYWCYWLSRGTPLPELNPKNPKFKLAIAAWRRMPLSLTKAFGPLIARNLP